MAKEKTAEKAKPSKKPGAKKVGVKKGTPSPKKGLPRVITPKVLANPGGRPSDFDEAAPKIIAYIRKGNTYECAAGCSRVSYATFNNWMNQGKEDIAEGNLNSKFVQFFYDVQQAETEAEEEAVNLWRTELPGNWQACKEFLARRNPDKWGAKDRVDLTSNGETVGKPIFLPLKKNAETEEE